MKDYYSHPRHQAASHEHGWLRMDYSGEFERDRMRTKMRGWGWRLVVTMALMLVVGLGGCQTFPQAEKALRIGISANKGHAADKQLPLEARAVAVDNHDLLWHVLFNIGGCEEKDIPPDVRKRMEARKAVAAENAAGAGGSGGGD